MVAKPIHLSRKGCLPLYILCAELSRFLSRRLQNVYQNICNLSYTILEIKKTNFQSALTFVLVKLDTKFMLPNSLKTRLLLLYFI